MKNRLDAVVIADDLTGAADTGVQFSAVGSPVFLLPVESLITDPGRMSSARGISVYTDTRRRCAQAAHEHLRRLSQALPEPRPRWIYKKIDSCLRGNPGTEIDALLDGLDFDVALVAPALPAQGRATIGGVHLVHGIPLAETEFARDPVTPVTCSLVADILAHQSRYPVGRIDLGDYASPERLQRALQRERGRGCRLIACDAADQTHLDRLAELVAGDAGRILPVGSAGLAASLVERLSAGAKYEITPVPKLRRLLMVCGTGCGVARGQFDALSDRHPGVRHELAPEWLAGASRRELRRRAAELLAAWTEGFLALQMGPVPPAGPDVPPGRAAAGLAELASEILRIRVPDGLFLSGGETADAFLHASGATAIRLERELLPGLVLGRWLDGVADGLPVITKAGAFGDEQTLIALYQRMCGETTS